MKNLKNEHGIALVIVLLMITVFSIIGMAIISLSISNTKQVQTTKQEMQAVDLAEMGVIYYKNAFIQNASAELQSAITNSITEIQSLNNQSNNQHIPVNKDNILKYLTINKDQYIPKIDHSISKQVPDTASPFSFQIENSNADYDNVNHILSVNFSSFGRVKRNQNSDIEKQLEGTITLDIKTLISDDINDRRANYQNYKSINGDAIIATINGGIKNSYWDISRNAIITTINGGIKNSFLNIVGNALFTTINGGIKDSYIYIGGDAFFTTIHGGINSNSKICVRGDIIGLIPNRDQIFSWKKDSAAYEANCNDNNISNSNVLLKDNLVTQANNINLKYH